MRPYVDEAICIGCGTCMAVCPADPVVFDVDSKSHIVHPESCTECYECVESCPVQAIELDD